MSSPVKQEDSLSMEEKRALLARLLQQKAAEAKTGYPLSFGQQALWFVYQTAPESVAYNVAITVRIYSPVDVPALQRVLQALVARHPALRTTFSIQDDEPIQEVYGYQEFSFDQIEAADYTWDELQQQVAAAHRQPFDLTQTPSLRVHLFTRSAQDHVLLLTLHHINCDAWSNWLLLDELGTLYAAERSGQPASLPPLLYQYTDYAQWQRDMLAGPIGEEMWNYWRQQLSGELPVLNLPTDRPYPASPSYQGDSYTFNLPDTLTQDLRELAQTEGVTLFVTLLAAFSVLLHRYAGQDDLIVGSPTTGRSQPKFAGIIGYFVNPIPLRANMSGNPTFRTFLNQVRQTVLDGLAHQDYPFPLLVERLQPSRHPGRSPIFQALFSLNKLQQMGQETELTPTGKQGKVVNLGGLEMEPYDLPQMEGQFDIMLELIEDKTSLLATLKYNPDLFDASTIVRMAGHFQTLLAGMVANPEQCIDELPMLDESERRRILVEWNATQADYSLNRTLHQWIEDQVERTPDAVALQFEVKRMTYRELNRRANQLARHLQALGVGPDTLVGICIERSLEMVVGLLGILKAGGAYVPFDPNYPQQRLAFMLEDSQTPVLLTQQSLLNRLPNSNARIICLDTNWVDIAGRPGDNLPCPVTPDHLAYTIYTSGSTGQPKGAMNTHRGICNRLLWMQEVYQLTPTDRVLQKTPFSFDVSVWEFFWPLMTGARLVVAKPGGHQDSAYLVSLIAEQQITTLHFVPSMLQIFLEEPNLGRCASLRQVMCSGEALSFELQERFFARLNAELHNLYGPTEAAVDVTFWQCERGSQRRLVPIGRPIANTQIYILDRYLQPTPIGVPGELHIGGVGLARGYLNRPELTEERFIRFTIYDLRFTTSYPLGIDDLRLTATTPEAKIEAEGSLKANRKSSIVNRKLYKTGDLARYLPDGAIEYLGRMDNQIKIRGFRIELGEIEATLASHPSVREVVVVAREDRPDDKRLIAYIVPTSSNHSTDLRHFLRQKLPDYMVPAAFVMLEAMPLSPNGKVDRRALPAPADLRSEGEVAYATPQTETEQQIAEIWQQVLQAAQVGIHDNFFDLGGHSLLLGRVRNRVQETFKQSLSMVEMFQYPTVYSLAKHLSRDRTPSTVTSASKQSQERAEIRSSRGVSTGQRRQLRQKFHKN